MSVESRLRTLEQTLAARRPPCIVRVQIVVVSTRQELAALDRLRQSEPPKRPQPPASGPIRLVQLPSTTAAEVLRAAGIVLPETEPANSDTFSEETLPSKEELRT